MRSLAPLSTPSVGCVAPHSISDQLASMAQRDRGGDGRRRSSSRFGWGNSFAVGIDKCTYATDETNG